MYLKIAGVEREIRMAQMTEVGRLFSGIVASDDFRFGYARPYHVSLFHNGVVAVEFDIVFSESIVARLAIAGLIGGGVIFLSALLLSAVLKADRSQRSEAFLEFARVEMRIGDHRPITCMCAMPTQTYTHERAHTLTYALLSLSLTDTHTKTHTHKHAKPHIDTHARESWCPAQELSCTRAWLLTAG